MNKTQKVAGGIIISVIVIFVLTIMYQSMIVIPQAKLEAEANAIEAKINAEREARVVRENNYQQCLATAWEVYSNQWDSTCVIDGKAKDCSLPVYRHQSIDQSYTVAKDRCLTLYTAN